MTSTPQRSAQNASVWTRDHVSAINDAAVDRAPIITEDDFCHIGPDLDIWDAWPIQMDDGTPAQFAAGVVLWIALASPRFPDPDTRHGHARLHLLQHSAAGWMHLGPVMPDGFSPGSREWSGSTVLDDDRVGVSLYFTAAGRRDETPLTFEQRLFHARADLREDAGRYRLENWRDLDEAVARDPACYMASDAGHGAVGTIKAFRDPAYFRDPADGGRYLFFAASRNDSDAPYNGVIGAARWDSRCARWQSLPPFIDATGVNNELERPHVVVRDGLYYLFWSTQTHVFDPAGPVGPTGLYGMVAPRLEGPWAPLNDTGLVFANPPEAPRQAYSWLVLPDLSVISFVDDWGRGVGDAGQRRFGASFAPTLYLRLDGRRAGLRA